MFFRKPKPIICAECGKPIAPREPRFVDKNRATKTARHIHTGCKPSAEPPKPD
jgi:hypothetical protein